MPQGRIAGRGRTVAFDASRYSRPVSCYRPFLEGRYMAEPNPFAAPQSNLDGAATGRRQYPNIELIARGQKLVIYAIVVNLASMGLRGAAPALLAFVGLGALALSLIGVYRIATG